MLQEDSNGETSFEIIDKKSEESSNGGDKTGKSWFSCYQPHTFFLVESLSTISSPYSIPSPGAISALPGGNLLSNLPPPSNLPDFTLWQTQNAPISGPSPLPPVVLGTENKNVPNPALANLQNIQTQPLSQPYPAAQFRYLLFVRLAKEKFKMAAYFDS